MMNLQFAPDWPVRCEFKFITSLPSLALRQSTRNDSAASSAPEMT